MFFHHPAWDEVRKIINELSIETRRMEHAPNAEAGTATQRILGVTYRGAILHVACFAKDHFRRAHSRGARVGHASLVAVMMASATIYFSKPISDAVTHTELGCAPMSKECWPHGQRVRTAPWMCQTHPCFGWTGRVINEHVPHSSDEPIDPRSCLIW